MSAKHLFAVLITIMTLVSPALTFHSGKSHPDPPRLAESFFSVSQNQNAPHVSITGRVKTPEGRGIKGAQVVIRDASTNDVVRSAYSSTFGYYRLEQIETGRMYVLSVSHRRYLFALPAQLLEINEARNGLDFIGEPSDD